MNKQTKRKVGQLFKSFLKKTILHDVQEILILQFIESRKKFKKQKLVKICLVHLKIAFN